jgi:transposase
VRKQLVGMRTETINQIRGLMKIFGLLLPRGSGARFEAQVRTRLAERAELRLVVEPLLAAWRALDDQVAALERQLVRRARRHEVCHRLMTVPVVGPLTALAFVTTVDDPTRGSGFSPRSGGCPSQQGVRRLGGSMCTAR